MNSPAIMGTLAQRMRHTPYQAYSYSYPHKAAYRSFEQPVELAKLWASEDRSALFGYIHIPFCEMRCGFCNLFAMARPHADIVDRYVDQVMRQMQVMADVLDERRFARFAFGGGTPTYLSASQLEKLLRAAQDLLGVDFQAIPSGIEASPETVTPDRLQVCRDAGIDRVSLGIQSFMAGEMRALARPQQNQAVTQAIRDIRAAGFPTLNVDLIYGIAGQTVESLLASIDSALEFSPEEIYLYPLYVRPQTGLAKIAGKHGVRTFDPLMLMRHEDDRLSLYEAARNHLRDAGYEQASMRMFRAPHAPSQDGPAYCCQTDGMVGFGAGARSYTSTVHYSIEYAVGRRETLGIIENFLAQNEASFAQARHGYVLGDEDQRRRYVIQSLLTEPGLEQASYQKRFGSGSMDDLPQLGELCELDLATLDDGLLRLTDKGYAYADTIGPWLVSERVRALMEEGGTQC